MGFGGVKQSGTGWREAGVEALDVYTEWKYVNLIADPAGPELPPVETTSHLRHGVRHRAVGGIIGLEP